jgi:hypothetical protein
MSHETSETFAVKDYNIDFDEQKTLDRILHYIEHPPENSRVMAITPKICPELLKYNESNRPQKSKKIAEYQKYMMAGEWMLTGDTIKFSNAKLLRDGQNRLKACERAGVPFRTHIVFGIDDEAFDRLDQGKNRNGADVLSIAGYQYVAALSGAVRWTHLIETGRAKSRDSYTPAEILRLLRERYEKLQSFVQPGRSIYSTTGQPISLVIALLYLFEKANAPKAAIFAEAWQSGKWAGKFKPIALMQKKIGNLHSMAAGRVHDVVRAALVIKSWNLFVAGKRGQPADLRWDTADPFPQISS